MEIITICYDGMGGENMNKEKFEWMLEEVAHLNGITKEQVRQEMQEVMEEGMRCPDPEVQQRWAQIPKQGEKVTLEEFVEYIINQCR